MHDSDESSVFRHFVMQHKRPSDSIFPSPVNNFFPMLEGTSLSRNTLINLYNLTYFSNTTTDVADLCFLLPSWHLKFPHSSFSLYSSYILFYRHDLTPRQLQKTKTIHLSLEQFKMLLRYFQKDNSAILAKSHSRDNCHGSISSRLLKFSYLQQKTKASDSHQKFKISR